MALSPQQPGLPPQPLADRGQGSTPFWALEPFLKRGSWDKSGVFTLGGLALII